MLTAGLKLGFMEIQTLNGGWCIYQAFLPYSTQCRPAIHVLKAYPKCQIIWPYIITMVLILPLIQNAFCNVVQHDIIKPTADIRDTSGGAVRRGRIGGGRGRIGGGEREEEGGKARGGRAREVTMGTGFSLIALISSRKSVSPDQPQQSVLERIEAEKLNKTLTGGKGCGNGR